MKRETAKEILNWFLPHPRHLNLEEAVLKFAKEIADKAWDDGWLNGDDMSKKGKSTFMKELFPEDIKDTSASG